MTTSEQLRNILDEATPKLEGAIAQDAFLDGFTPEVRLAYTVCGIATAAVQIYLLDQYSIPSERVIRTPEKAPRELWARRMQHVTLLADTEDQGRVEIDPTWRQVFRYVGLTPARVVTYPKYAELYPAEAVALFPQAEHDAFADAAAETARAIAPRIHPPNRGRLRLMPPEGILHGASYEEIQELYRNIWGTENADQFTLASQRASFQTMIDRIVERMKAPTGE